MRRASALRHPATWLGAERCASLKSRYAGRPRRPAQRAEFFRSRIASFDLVAERNFFLCFLLFGAAALACSSSAPPGNVPDGSAEATIDCPNDLPDNDDCATAAPSYDVDVAPVIATRCTICHTPGGAETSRLFGSYAQAYALRREMLTQIFACRMPLPPALPLTPDERHTMLKWFVCGAPGSSDAAAP